MRGRELDSAAWRSRLPHGRFANRSVGSPARVGILAVALACAAAWAALAVSQPAGRPSVESVSVVAGEVGLTVDVLTNAADPPQFKLFAVGNPERLVLDMPGLAWGPGSTQHTVVSAAGIERVRVGSFREDPPITRIVFDLMGKREELRYRVERVSGSGGLRVRFSPPHAAEPPVGQASPEARVGALDGAEPVPARMRGAPDIAGRGDIERSSLLASLVAAVLAAAIALGSGRWLTRLRCKHLGEALESGEDEARLQALERLQSYPICDLLAIRSSLLCVVSGSSGDAARAASALIEERIPPDRLLSELSGGSPEAREQIALLLQHYPPEHAADAILGAAMRPSDVRDVAVRALAHHARSGLVQRLVVTLAGENVERRELAAEAMTAAAPESIQHLLAGLKERDPEVRIRALAAVAALAPEGGVAGIAALLSDPVPAVRARAVRALGSLQAVEQQAQGVVGALSDPSDQVRRVAALTLARAGEPHVSALLVRAVEQQDVECSDELVEALAAGCAEPTPEWVMLLSTREAELSWVLAQHLEGSARPGEWLAGLAAPDPGRRALMRDALEALGRHGCTSALLRGLHSRDATIESECAAILGWVGDRKAVGALGEIMSSPAADARTAAVEALGMIGGDEAALLLVSAVDDPEPMVRQTAIGAVARCLAADVSGPCDTESDGTRGAAVRALESGLADSTPAVRAAAAFALSVVGALAAAPALAAAAVSDPDAAARRAAADALGELRPVCVASAVKDSVEGASSVLQRRAIEVLRRSGDPAGTGLLLEMLDSEDGGVREEAARALHSVAADRDAESLICHLRHTDPNVRGEVAGVLGGLNAAEYADSLASATADPDSRVRIAVLNALHKLGEAAGGCLDQVAERIHDVDAGVRTAVPAAMAALAPTSEEAARGVVPLILDAEASVREAGAVCLLDYAERGIAAPLMELLGDVVRRPVALEVLQYADAVAIRRLLRTAHSHAGSQGRAALELLTYVMGTRWSVDELKPDLESLDPAVRLAGVEAIGVRAGDGAISDLRDLLRREPSRDVRAAIIGVLGRLSVSEASDVLREASERDPDPVIREAAAALSAGRQGVPSEPVPAPA